MDSSSGLPTPARPAPKACRRSDHVAVPPLPIGIGNSNRSGWVLLSSCLETPLQLTPRSAARSATYESIERSVFHNTTKYFKIINLHLLNRYKHITYRFYIAHTRNRRTHTS